MDYIINFLAGGLLHLSWWQVALVTLVLTHITIISVTIFFTAARHIGGWIFIQPSCTFSGSGCG